jgi:hypothetical protein
LPINNGFLGALVNVHDIAIAIDVRRPGSDITALGQLTWGWRTLCLCISSMRQKTKDN